MLLIPEFAPNLSGNPLAALPLLFAAGVGASLTPCVYPMIPITAAIIGGQSTAQSPTGEPIPVSKWRPIGLSFVYAMGLASVYAGLGLLAGLTGTMFGTISSNPWSYFTIGNLLMLSALAMLDVIPIRVPQSILQRASTAGTGGRALGAFVMGAASGLVAAPCSAPVMVAVIAWVSTTQNAVLGFFYLLTFSLGMCLILVIVGISAGTVAKMPRAGMWMIWVKRIFAVVMLGIAEYYLVKMGQVYF